MLSPRSSTCAPAPDKILQTTKSLLKPKPGAKSEPITAWHHVPNRLTLLWLCISIPLVAWDTVYMLLRPLTMEGGSLHWPLWVPYKLYGEVDHVYGWKSYNAKNGFSGAQSFLNLIESGMYCWYLWLVWRMGKVAGDGSRVVMGRQGAEALLVGFSAAVMTLSKTVLYCKSVPPCGHSSTDGVGACEYYSGFDNIGHNPFLDLIYLWIIPK